MKVRERHTQAVYVNVMNLTVITKTNENYTLLFFWRQLFFYFPKSISKGIIILSNFLPAKESLEERRTTALLPRYAK